LKCAQYKELDTIQDYRYACATKNLRVEGWKQHRLQMWRTKKVGEFS
jgi:hypothetical protein